MSKNKQYIYKYKDAVVYRSINKRVSVVKSKKDNTVILEFHSFSETAKKDKKSAHVLSSNKLGRLFTGFQLSFEALQMLYEAIKIYHEEIEPISDEEVTYNYVHHH